VCGVWPVAHGVPWAMQADLKGNFGWEIPAVFLSLPGPILYIVLAVLGWVLWLTMEPGCDTYYDTTVGLLYIIFHIQVSVCVFACLHASMSRCMSVCQHARMHACCAQACRGRTDELISGTHECIVPDQFQPPHSLSLAPSPSSLPLWQVILLTVAAIFGLITCIAQGTVLIAQISSGGEPALEVVCLCVPVCVRVCVCVCACV